MVIDIEYVSRAPSVSVNTRSRPHNHYHTRRDGLRRWSRCVWRTAHFKIQKWNCTITENAIDYVFWPGDMDSLVPCWLGGFGTWAASRAWWAPPCTPLHRCSWTPSGDPGSAAGGVGGSMCARTQAKCAESRGPLGHRFRCKHMWKQTHTNNVCDAAVKTPCEFPRVICRSADHIWQLAVATPIRQTTCMMLNNMSRSSFLLDVPCKCICSQRASA